MQSSTQTQHLLVVQTIAVSGQVLPNVVSVSMLADLPILPIKTLVSTALTFLPVFVNSVLIIAIVL